LNSADWSVVGNTPSGCRVSKTERFCDGSAISHHSAAAPKHYSSCGEESGILVAPSPSFIQISISSGFVVDHPKKNISFNLTPINNVQDAKNRRGEACFNLM